MGKRNAQRARYLDPKKKVRHIDITKIRDLDKLVAAMGETSFSARDLSQAADYFDKALRDRECNIFLCLAGSLVSAGLKHLVTTMVENNMVDAIVATGAIVVDQDFFEGLGYSHYRGSRFTDDQELRALRIDRIYDHYIDEENLRICDDRIRDLANALPPRPYTSREIIARMGEYLSRRGKRHDGFVEAAWRKHVPVFVPAFADCSAGFGLIDHQHHRLKEGKPMVTLDAARDFLDLSYLKCLASRESAIIMIGGGVPKNFMQDAAVAAETFGETARMHKYAVQLTVADERDGALSGSTLREASSWGKVDLACEQMVYGEATVTMPLLVGAVYARGAHRKRKARELALHFDDDGRFLKRKRAKKPAAESKRRKPARAAR